MSAPQEPLCVVHGLPFIWPGICPFCDYEDRRNPQSRREWAQVIAAQYESDDIDAIEEGIARGVLLSGAQELCAAIDGLLDSFEDTPEAKRARDAVAKARGESA